MIIASTHQNIDRATFTAMESKLSATVGQTITGDEGKGEKDGVGITWLYTPNTQTLVLTCYKHPFFVPASVIQEHLDSLS